MQQGAAVMEHDREVIPGGLAAPGTTEGRTSTAVNAYRRDQIANMTPVEVVKRLYDVAILGCKKNDGALARKAVTELMVSLNFEYQEMSASLYWLYDYVKRCIREGKMDDALRVLEPLRATWAEAFQLE